MSDDGYRLSPQQKHLWQLHGASVSAHLAEAWIRIRGGLEEAGLQAALQRLPERHEILRTGFKTLPGLHLPVQVIGDSGAVDFAALDLRDLSPDAQGQKCAEGRAEARRAGFDLGVPGLLRGRLFRLSDSELRLQLVLPALCADRRSLEVLVRDLGAFAGGSADPGGEVLQYADLAEWLHESVEAGDNEPGKAYWRGRPRSGPEGVRLPFERPREGAFQPESVPLSLAPATLAAVDELARADGDSAEGVLLAAWQSLLFRLLESRSPVIGAASRRVGPELAGALGPVTRYLPIAAQIEGRMEFREAVRRARASLQEANEWQYALSLEPPGGGPPDASWNRYAFDFWASEASLDSGGSPRFEIEESIVCSDRFGLRLSASRKRAGLGLALDYDPSVLAREHAHWVARRFETLLHAAASQPDTAVDSLPLVGEEERRALLVDFNRTRWECPSEGPIHALLEAQAREKAAGVAVAFEDVSLTYEQLDARANRVAAYLRGKKVSANARVGLLVERSPEMVVGILGILKAGGAYVPLDPKYPGERLAFMIQDSQARAVLAPRALIDTLPAGTAEVFCLEEAEAAGSPDLAAGAPPARPDDLAYVIYTSGSTGRPKGVPVAHRQLTHSTLARGLHYSEGVGAFLLLSSFAFDSSVAGIFWTLCTGGTLVLPRQGEEQDVERLASLIERHRVSHMLCLPSLYNVILTEAAPKSLETLKAVIVAGEACPPALAALHYGRLPAARLHNEYGPTEGTVWTTVYELPSPLPEGPVSIGRPIANATVYVLGEVLEPLPIGLPGELWVGGAGVVRGYLDRPDLTGEKFLADPFSDEPGARLYRSGDLVRFRADGNLEFLGRVDDQVKVRGYRIELGEIEAALLRHPAVKEAVVHALEEADGRKRLAAYLVPRDGQKAALGEMRDFLSRDLPEYMIPAAWAVLPDLPRLPNGKVDRKRLPAPTSGAPEDLGRFVAPRNEKEKCLAEIWGKVLGVPRVGIQDNFFELGGDSILSIRMVAEASRAGLKITPMMIFQHQTVAALAAQAQQSAAGNAEEDAATGEFPLTPIQHWFFEQQLTDLHHWNMSLLLELKEPLTLPLLETAARELARHHDALRLRFRKSGASWIQEVAGPDQASVTVQRVDLAAASPDELEGALAREGARLQAGLDLALGPLARMALFDLGPQRPSRLLIVVHHLAIDGVSWQILLDDLEAIYLQLQRGETPRVPPRTTSLKRWARGLVSRVEEGAFEDERSYWLEAKRGGRALPVDHREGEDTVASARVLSRSLGAAETTALLQRVPEAYNTQINDVLLTALATALCEWLGPSDVAVTLEGHGREEIVPDADLTRTLGWFTALFPSRLSLPEGGDPGARLRSIKEQLRAIPRRGIGYGLLRYLDPDPARRQELAALADPEINFNYLGQFDRWLADSRLFRLLSEPAGPEQSPRARRRDRLECLGTITQGQLRLDWVWSTHFHRRETVERLADRMLEALRELIAHCVAGGVGRYTPSDFPEAGLEQAELDAFLATLD